MTFFNLSSAPSLRRSSVDSNNIWPAQSSIKSENQTVFSRTGFRGVGAESFLISHGLTVPSEPNQSILFNNSLVILRLSKTEFWLVCTDSSQHEFVETLELASQEVSDVYRLFCQHSHACFAFKGEQTATMFSKVCGVDLSHEGFPIGGVAQTSVARVNAIVTRQYLKGEASKEEECFIVLSDLASAPYLWSALADAANEFS
ncbi:sarcosine oxidase subunit gamma [Marinomonas arenicola]|uniref:Sarcosine oxidase subunit gamma n=1 Tax=Marinomonas arenicola TaxID=569601 RepID=A0ABU9G4N5_9GAMM